MFINIGVCLFNIVDFVLEIDDEIEGDWGRDLCVIRLLIFVLGFVDFGIGGMGE